VRGCPAALETGISVRCDNATAGAAAASAITAAPMISAMDERIAKIELPQSQTDNEKLLEEDDEKWWALVKRSSGYLTKVSYGQIYKAGFGRPGWN
jgi:hypothetical protein